MGLSEVSNILWRERQLLELLLFKLEEEQLLLANGRTRWLAHAAGEIEDILDEVKAVELARAMEVASLADQLGIDSNASLRELVEAAPAPWGHILDDHRTAFMSAVAEVQSMADSNRELIARGQRDVQDALSWLGANRDETYSASGTTTRTSGSSLFDRTF